MINFNTYLNMKNIINIGIPSKGRLRKDVLKIFSKKRLKLISQRGERDLIGSIQNKSNIKILYLQLFSFILTTILFFRVSK